MRIGDCVMTTCGRTMRMTRLMSWRSCHVGHDAAVHVAEEVQRGDTDLGGRLRLLLTTDRRHLGARDRAIEPARLAVGDEAVHDLDPGVGEHGDRAGGREIDVVGVRHDDERTFDLGRLQHQLQSTAISAANTIDTSRAL